MKSAEDNRCYSSVLNWLLLCTVWHPLGWRFHRLLSLHFTSESPI